MTTDHLMNLSTQVAPAATFTVDDSPYELLGVDHLSPREEATVMALFSRYEVLSEKLGKTADDNQAQAIAMKMRKARIDLLSKMTTCPAEIMTKVPLTGQNQLMQAIAKELNGGDDAATDPDLSDDEETPEDGS